MDTLTIASPAKINLFLELVARRSDGYHEIESVMQLVDLCDRVHARKARRGVTVTVSGADVPAGRGNLAHRAAALLLGAAGDPGGVQVHLEKRIPVAGGLGGGSSNAAAVLVAVNRLYELGFSQDRLQALALQLGSDVPFFLTDGLALARGRGEVLTPLRPWPPQWLVIANPGVPISTAWAYREASSKLTLDGARATMPALTAGDRLAWPPIWAFNRLEAVVLPHKAEVRSLRALLEDGGGSPVCMSGSGASLFAVVPTAEAAEGLAARAREAGTFAVPVTTLPANPILAA
jgi:4-diphosphocytidyl-2-C-methyl-D-erythritol kinase